MDNNSSTDYGSSSTSINNELTGVRSDILNLNGISFDGWTGSAKESYQSSLNSNMSNLEIEFEKVTVFAELLNQVEVYKQNKTQIENLQNQYNSLPSDPEYDDERANLSSQISTLTSENEQLKATLNAAFASFGGVGSKVSVGGSSMDTATIANSNIRVQFNIKEILSKFSGGGLHYLNDGESLYDYYGGRQKGREYVRQVLAKIQSVYSGREAAVNSALALLKLCSDAGIKIDYQHKGTMGVHPYVPTDEVATGVDCNPMASWIVDKGTPGGFVWRPVGGFNNVGETLQNWVNAQPGDVILSSGHVGVIIQNDPSKHMFITAESSHGVELKTRSYDELNHNGYQIRDMTNVYNGTQNTYRNVFDQYIDKDTFQRDF